MTLAACTLHIGEKSTDSAGGTEAATEATGEPGSSGEAPTSGATVQVTSGEGSSGEGSSGTEATGTGGPVTGDPSGATTGATDDSGSTVGSSGGTGEPVFGDATVDDSCAPDDGPALEFRLQLEAPVCGAQWPGDVLRVVLFQGGPLPPGDYVLDGGNGFAWLQQDGQAAQSSDVGTITIDAWAGDMVSGSYLLPGFGLAGSFAGPHCVGGALCG